MAAEKKMEDKTKVKGKRKVWRWVVPAVVVLVVGAVLLVPVVVSSGAGNRLIVSKINKSVDGKMELGGLSMSWWRGVRLRELSFADGTGQTLVKVKEIITHPSYLALLSGKVFLGVTRIEQPVIEINMKEAAKPGTSQPKPAGSGAGGMPIKQIDLTVNDGALKVTTPKSGKVAVSQINSHVQLRGSGQESSADVSMAVDSGSSGKVTASAKAVPDKGWTLKGTSGQLSVEVNELDLESLGPIFAMAGVTVEAKGKLSADMKSEVKEGQVEGVSGVITGKGLEIAGQPLKGDRVQMPSLNVVVQLKRQQEQIAIEKLDIEGGWVSAGLKGVIPMTFKSLDDFLAAGSAYTLDGKLDVDVATAAGQMPHLLGLKEGMKVTSGKLAGTVGTVSEGGRKMLSGSVSLSGLEGSVDGKKISLSEPVQASLQVSSDKGVMKFEKLEVTSAFAKATGSGTSTNLSYQVQADLGKLQSELGQFVDMKGYQVVGQISEKGEASMKPGRTSMAGRLEIKTFGLTSATGTRADEPQAAVDYSLAIEPNREVLAIEYVKVAAGLGQVDITNSVVPTSEKSKEGMKLGVSAKAVDLAKVGQFGLVLGYLPKDLQVSGIVDANVSLTGGKQGYHIATDSTRIKELKVVSGQKKPFEQKDVLIVFDVDADTATKDISVKKLELTSPQIKVKGQLQQKAAGKKTKLEGQADLEYDWKTLSSLIGAYLPAGLELEGVRKDAIRFSSEYTPDQNETVLSHLNTAAQVGFSKGSYMGLNFGPTEVKLQVDGGILKIPPFSTKVNNGQLNFGGEADMRQKQPVFRMTRPMKIADQIEINKEMGAKLFSFINPFFANAAGVSGVVDFNCAKLALPLGGAQAEKVLSVDGTISMERVRIEGSGLLATICGVFGKGAPGEDFRIHPTAFKVENGFLQYEDMQLDVGNNPFNFGGRIGLDKSLNMTVTVPWTIEGKTAQVGKPSVGERVSLPLEGTTDKPKLDTAKFLELQLKQQLKDKVFKGLDGLLK